MQKPVVHTGKTVIVSAAVDPQLREVLIERATQSDRTLSGEIRHTLRIGLGLRPLAERNTAT